MSTTIERHDPLSWHALQQDSTYRELSASPNWIWRGQAQPWTLIPSLWRHALRFDYDGWSLVKEHLREFLDLGARLAGKDINVDEYSNPQLSAFAQHYGLLTPSLDWTRNPRIALFFAFADAQSRRQGDGNAQNGHRCIDALHLPTVREYHRNLIDSERRMATHDPHHFNRGLEAVSLDDLIGGIHENGKAGADIEVSQWLPRLEKQEAVLLFVWRAGSGKSVEAHLSKNQAFVPQLVESPHCRFLVSEGVLRERIECLNHLAETGITFRSLFPDLEGLARHMNLKAQLTGYCGANPDHYQSDQDPYRSE